MKPNWKDAPEWAWWWAQDFSGWGRWHEYKPSPGIEAWVSAGRNRYEDDYNRPIWSDTSNWRETKEQRPEAQP